ncbi:MAG: helix-turn-helix domain-containing protein [Actinobacteria bacterium]|nr:helix-turn-helix domain-containing protein [Actinomycetota bacterium]
MQQLGSELQRVRKMRGLSLKAVAGPAEISPAYLQKLERGEVKSPSPHILHGLAKALEVKYVDLMRAAGYLLPDNGQPAEREHGASLLAQALSSEDLTPEEERQVADFLAYLRHRRPRES